MTDMTSQRPRVRVAQDAIAFRRSTCSPVREVLSLLLGADELDDGVEELLAFVALLLLENKHEIVVETRLHHHPVDSSRQVDVGGEEDDVFALQRRDALVLLHEVRHHLLETALPLARRARTRTVVRPEKIQTETR